MTSLIQYRNAIKSTPESQEVEAGQRSCFDVLQGRSSTHVEYFLNNNIKTNADNLRIFSAALSSIDETVLVVFGRFGDS